MSISIKLAKEDDIEDSLLTNITIDDMRFTFHFNFGCPLCDNKRTKSQWSLDNFKQRFNNHSLGERLSALNVSRKQFSLATNQIVSCVGCKISIEKRLSRVPLRNFEKGFKPFCLDPDGSLSVVDSVATNADELYSVLHHQGFKNVLESVPKCKRGRRCSIHSLETMKARFLGDWVEVWSVMNEDARQEILIVDDDTLLDNLERYLRKHKFCIECKNKVLKAYEILIEGFESVKEKDFCPSLYEGIRCCPSERHIHVLADRRLITKLLTAAESEMSGSRRERHAKTLAIAQEEILTCIGLYLYDRFLLLSQTMHLDKLAWKLLYYIGIDCMRKNFYAFNNTAEYSDFDEFCELLESTDRNRRQKRQQKRQRLREKRKNKCERNNESNLKSFLDVLNTAPPESMGHVEELLSCDEDEVEVHLKHRSSEKVSRRHTKKTENRTFKEWHYESGKSDPGYCSGQSCSTCQESIAESTELTSEQRCPSAESVSSFHSHEEMSFAHLYEQDTLIFQPSVTLPPVDSRACNKNTDIGSNVDNFEGENYCQPKLEIEQLLEDENLFGIDDYSIPESVVKEFKMNENAIRQELARVRRLVRERFEILQKKIIV